MQDVHLYFIGIAQNFKIGHNGSTDIKSWQTDDPEDEWIYTPQATFLVLSASPNETLCPQRKSNFRQLSYLQWQIAARTSIAGPKTAQLFILKAFISRPGWPH
jgi:hypothetical protein